MYSWYALCKSFIKCMERTLNIGRLNKKIEVAKMISVSDDMGQSQQRLEKLYELHATLYGIRGNELFELQKIQSKITHKCYIRFYEGIDTNCFIIHDDKIYSIESVIDVDLCHKFLEINCALYTGKEIKIYEPTSSA